MAFDLRGTTALVTGAGSGIGSALATALAARGAGTLVLAGRRRARLEAVAARIAAGTTGISVLVRPVDLTDRAAAEALVAGLEAEGRACDVLVNNAGFGDRCLFDRRPWQKIEALLELNVVAATFLLHRTLPGMLARGRGAILNIGSIAGIVPRPGSAVYGASKAYLNLLSEALHAELHGTGVVVTAVLPGPIPTEFGALAAQEDDSPVGAGAREPSSPVDPPRLPGPFVISADECAAQALDALEREAARVVTGRGVRALAHLMERTPRVAMRAFMARAARRMRLG